MKQKLVSRVLFFFIGFILQSCLSAPSKNVSESFDSPPRQPTATRQREDFVLSCYLRSGRDVDSQSYALVRTNANSEMASYTVYSRGQPVSQATNARVTKWVEPYFNGRHDQWEFYLELNLGRSGSLKMGWHPELQLSLASLEHKEFFRFLQTKRLRLFVSSINKTPRAPAKCLSSPKHFGLKSQASSIRVILGSDLVLTSIGPTGGLQKSSVPSNWNTHSKTNCYKCSA